MTITTEIPDSALPAWEIRLVEFNAGSNKPPVNLQQYWQILVTEATDNYVAAKLDTDNLALVPITTALSAVDQAVREDILTYAKRKLGLE